jgi:hypothetical protein
MLQKKNSMGLFDLIKSRYFPEETLSLVESKELEKIVEKNLWPEDYIEMDNKSVHVYSSEVRLLNVLEYFKRLIPWLHFEAHNLEQLEKNPGDAIVAKYLAFNQLVGLLEATHIEWAMSGVPERNLSKVKKDYVRLH